MKISFVIPAFNEEAYIGRCLESIIGEVSKHQADAEIIVVNNASTDKTAEVAKSYPGVKVVDEPRKSAVQARHTGYLNASGDLIAGIDADSALTPNWFSIVQKEFNSDQKLVGLSGPYIYDDVSKRLRRAIGIYYRIAFIVYFVMKFIFRTSSMMQGGNMVIRKSALDQLGGYDLSFSFYGDDTDLARRLHSLGNVKFISKLNVYSSGRRMMGEGIFLTGFRYATNYFSTVFFKRPATKDYVDVRVTNSEGKLLAYEPANKRKEFMVLAAAILVLMTILGTTGFLVASSVDAKETPKEFTVRMYHKFSDGDGDFDQIQAQIREAFAKKWNYR